MVALHSVNSWFVSKHPKKPAWSLHSKTVADFVLYFELRLVYIQKVDCIITNKQNGENNLDIKRPWK